MNGRIYDFNVGRFLSVDPFLQFPENSQSANPYSYILNNPMSGIDPTGYRTEELDEVISGKSFEKMEVFEDGSIHITADGETYNVTSVSVSNGDTNVSVSFTGNKGDTTSVSKQTALGNGDSNPGDSSKSNFNEGAYQGKLENESVLGKAPSDPEQIYKDGESASRDIPSIRKGEGREFVNKFAIAYVDNNGKIKVRSFSSFKDANEFADKTNGKWPEAVERGGFITLYRTATYSKVVANRFNPYQKMQLTSVESVIYNLAHEGAHTRYGPAHDLRLEAISFGAVEQYRELSK